MTRARCIGYPTLTPWVSVASESPGIMVFERNPYYFKVDTEGKQLPYIDKIVSVQVEDVEMVNQRVLAGDVDVHLVVVAVVRDGDLHARRLRELAAQCFRPALALAAQMVRVGRVSKVDVEWHAPSITSARGQTCVAETHGNRTRRGSDHGPPIGFEVQGRHQPASRFRSAPIQPDARIRVNPRARRRCAESSASVLEAFRPELDGMR